MKLMIAGGGEWNGRRILSPASVELMRTNQLPDGVGWIGFGDEERTGVGFGLGFAVVLDPAAGKYVCSPGELSWGGFNSRIISSKRRRLVER